MICVASCGSSFRLRRSRPLRTPPPVQPCSSDSRIAESPTNLGTTPRRSSAPATSGPAAAWQQSHGGSCRGGSASPSGPAAGIRCRWWFPWLGQGEAQITGRRALEHIAQTRNGPFGGGVQHEVRVPPAVMSDADMAAWNAALPEWARAAGLDSGSLRAGCLEGRYLWHFAGRDGRTDVCEYLKSKGLLDLIEPRSYGRDAASRCARSQKRRDCAVDDGQRRERPSTPSTITTTQPSASPACT